MTTADLLPRTRLGWAAVLVFLAVSLPIAVLGRGERSAWIHQTSPVEGIATNSLLGYAYLLGEEPIHKENTPSIGHVVVFCGASADLGMYAVRPVYALAASLLQPFLGILGSLLAVNYLAWAAAVWIGWRLARALFEDEVAAFVAAALVSCGSGMAFHIADLSAHLMAFTTYYLGILLLHESGVWREERPLRTHLALGVFLALSCLQYNMGIALTAGYLLVSLRRNRWWHLAASAAIALSAQRIWHFALNVIDARLNGASAPTNFYATEQGYAERALAAWRGAFHAGWGHFLGTIAAKVKEFAYFDSPPIVALGIVALAVLLVRRPRLAWFFLVFVGPPFGAGLYYSSTATARGYLVYGASLLFYVAIAGLFASIWRRASGAPRAVATAVLAAAILVQVAWSGADVALNFGPVKSYTYGMRPWVGSIASAPLVVSMTGHEPTPELFTGRASLVEAGAPGGPPRTDQTYPTVLAALGTRAVFVGYAAALVLLLAERGRRLRALRILAIATLATALLSAVTLRKRPLWSDTDNGVRLSGGARLSYEVELSQELVDALAARVAEGDCFELFACIHGAHELRVAFGGREVPFQRFADMAVFRPGPVIEALLSSRRLSIRVEAGPQQGRDVLTIPAWQRGPRRGRTLAFEGAQPATDLLPAFEVRLRDANGLLKVGGF